MARPPRSFVTTLGVVLAMTACGSADEDGVVLPGLDGAPDEIDVNRPPPLPTTSVASSAVGVEAGAASTTTQPDVTTTVAPGTDDVPAEPSGDAAPDDDAEVAGAPPDTAPPPESEAADPAPDTTAAPDVFLRRGDEGPEVASVQRRLIALEYLPPGGETGVFDAATADALIDFQAQYGLVVDGIFGPESDRALNAAAASVDTEG